MVLYFAKLHKNKNNQYEVYFPDLEPYAATFGDSLNEALQSAHDSLVGYLLTCEDSQQKVPESSVPKVLQSDLRDNDFLVPVKINLKIEREKERTNSKIIQTHNWYKQK